MSWSPPAALADYLRAHAESLDRDATHAGDVLPALAAAQAVRAGIDEAHGGTGGPVSRGIEAIAAVARQSLSAAFVLWGQRAFAEYLVQSPHPGLRERWLADVLDGRIAGASGLSNAMKFLSGIESLGVQAQPAPGGGEGARSLSGRVPWATNLRPAGFVVAVAVEGEHGPFVAALPSDRPGLARSPDHDLIALRGSNTAALALANVALDDGDVIARDARSWLPRVRPAFLGLQCGMSIGLARAALDAARERVGPAKTVLDAPIAAASQALDAATAALLAGVDDGRFVARAAPLFELRIRLAEIALQAAQLELQASGGRAYHHDAELGFARRWREAAFLPIVTPSLSQLQGELNRQRAREGAAA